VAKFQCLGTTRTERNCTLGE